MKKTFETIGVIAIISITVFTIFACSGSGGSRVLNSADALKEYLDSQLANSPDKPIKVNMNINDLMLKDIVDVINTAGKYVNIDFSRSTGLTVIGERAFRNSQALTGIVLPNSVTSIGREAFRGCTNLTTITLDNNISDIGEYAFRELSNLTDFTVLGIDTSLNGTWDFISYDSSYNVRWEGSWVRFNNGFCEISYYEGEKALYIARDGEFINDGSIHFPYNRYSVNGDTLILSWDYGERYEEYNEEYIYTKR